MNVVEDYLAGTSQKDLAAGVLKQAAQDLRRFYDANSATERELYRDAYSWVVSSDQEWPFSFLNVCQLLKLTPEILRLELLGDASVGPIAYGIRRCSRVARSLQAFVSSAFKTNRGSTTVDPVPLTVHAFQ